MTLPYRRPGLLVAAVVAVLASLLAPVTAFAAVANETTLTVTFVDAVTLLSVDRAAVHVTAHQDGAVIAELDGETDAAGISVLINLPHDTGEDGVVTLDVTAHKETSFTDSETGCVMNDTWDASRLGVPVDDVALAVAFTADEQQATSSVQCPPDQPAPTGEVGGAVGTPGPTLPPTDTVSAGDAGSSGLAVVVAALLGASAFVLFLVPRRRRAEVRVERRVRRGAPRPPRGPATLGRSARPRQSAKLPSPDASARSPSPSASPTHDRASGPNGGVHRDASRSECHAAASQAVGLPVGTTVRP